MIKLMLCYRMYLHTHLL